MYENRESRHNDEWGRDIKLVEDAGEARGKSRACPDDVVRTHFERPKYLTCD